MKNCDRCNQSIKSEEERTFNSKLLCEDCYIDVVLPPTRKPYYNNGPSEFMRRLQDNHTVCTQKYH